MQNRLQFPLDRNSPFHQKLDFHEIFIP
jgi:hypothetical protein